MSQYRLYTSGPYKQNNGSAITRSSTDVDLGAAKNVRDSDNLNRVDWLSGGTNFPDLVGGRDVSPAEFTSVYASDGTASESTEGLVQVTMNSAHGLTKDMVVKVSADVQLTTAQTYRVVRVVSATDIVINLIWNANYSTITNWTVLKATGTFATQGDENFIMMKNDATVHGQANTKLSSGASDYGRRKVAKFDESLSTVRTATAMRQGKYDQYSGEFDSTFPVVATDTLNADDVTVDSSTKIGLKGELQFREGGPNPAQKDYTAKTN